MSSSIQFQPATLVLIDPDDDKREVLAERLRAQGYSVHTEASPAEAIGHSLAEPPTAVVADLWMPGISGVQLCRLLGSEPATSSVPVILRAVDHHPRNRFWAERAGAAAYVNKGRMGMLVRALEHAIAAAPEPDGFFTHLDMSLDIRDRICQLLDAELFDSVIAAEVRSLSSCETFPRLFDLLSQFVSRVARYRWLALRTEDPARIGLHYHPAARESAQDEVCELFGIDQADATWVLVEDEDASAEPMGPPPAKADVNHGRGAQATLAMSATEREVSKLVAQVATELGGPIRIVNLVEETQRLASYDPLTATRNRRSFLLEVAREVERSDRYDSPLSMLLLDVDHFKPVNDEHGHGAGDRALTAVGQALNHAVRAIDVVGRWGGEEFVVALPETNLDSAKAVAERIRQCIANTSVVLDTDVTLSVTASVGVAEYRSGETLAELIDRADKAMYRAKLSGRNRVMTAEDAPMLSVVDDALVAAPG